MIGLSSCFDRPSSDFPPAAMTRTAPSTCHKPTDFPPMPQTEEKQFAQVLREELSPTEYAAHVRPFRAGEIIFATGDVGDGLYVIETGRVQIAAAVNSSGPQRLASIGPGDFFGEMAVVDDAPVPPLRSPRRTRSLST